MSPERLEHCWRILNILGCLSLSFLNPYCCNRNPMNPTLDSCRHTHPCLIRNSTNPTRPPATFPCLICPFLFPWQEPPLRSTFPCLYPSSPYPSTAHRRRICVCPFPFYPYP